MDEFHVISDELLDKAKVALMHGNSWMCYNEIDYFLDTGNVHFFKTDDEAYEFSASNISEYDLYAYKQVNSIEELLQLFSCELDYSKVLQQEPLKAEANNDLSQLNFDVMNEKNFDYLKDQLKYTGFGEAHENELKDYIQRQPEEFKLTHKAEFGKDVAVAELHFKKSTETDMYFFNNYHMVLNPESNDKVQQLFYINKDNNITFKEAFNLLNGRAVNKDLTNKEGTSYNAWVQLDFKETEANGNYQLKKYHQNYGYDIESVLSAYSIRELGNEQDKGRLIESLKRGNLQAVTFVHDGNEKKQFIEANPQFKTINIYDSNAQRVKNNQQQSEGNNNGERQSARQSQKNEQQGAGDDSEGGKSSNRRRQGHSNKVS